MPSLRTRILYVQTEPTVQVAGQTVNDIPVAGSVSAPSGGAVVDTEARDALADLLSSLQGAGFLL
jgi:hypothetical protein